MGELAEDEVTEKDRPYSPDVSDPWLALQNLNTHRFSWVENLPKRRLRSKRGLNPCLFFLAASPGGSPTRPPASAQLGGKLGLELPPQGLDPVLGGVGVVGTEAARRRVGTEAGPGGDSEEEEVQVQPRRRSGREQGKRWTPVSPRPSPASSLTPGRGPVLTASRLPALGQRRWTAPRVDYGGEIPGE